MKCLKIILIILISFIFSINCNEVYVEESFIFGSILTILGVSFAAYTFLYTPLSNVIQNQTKVSRNLINLLKKLLKELADNIKFIFLSLLVVMLINMFYKINIPFLKDIYNIKILNIQVYSLKNLIYDFLKITIFNFSFFAFYDIIDATFKIYNGCFNMYDKTK